MMARSGASNVFGDKRKYSIDGPDNLKNLEKRFIGLNSNENTL